jgi:4-aminobutyrate aminotransferase-like enzyme
MITEDKILAHGKRAAEVLWAGLSELFRVYSKLIGRLSGFGLLVGVHFINK